MRSAMRTRALVLKALELKGFDLDQNGRTRCPAHSGSDNNLAVGETDGDVWVKCFSRGCTTEEIYRALDIWIDLKPGSGTSTYELRQNGRKVGTKTVNRDTDPKTIGGMTGLHPKLLDPYLSWNLNGSKLVVVAEGERATDALVAAGHPAVGIQNATTIPEDLTSLDGRDVFLWPDADEPGRKAMLQLAKQLGRPVKMVEPPAFAPKGWDAADAGKVVIDALVASAIDYEPPKLKALFVPLTDVSLAPPPPKLLGFLDPEGATILQGDGGVGKGTIACQWIVDLVGLGYTVGILDYEAHKGEWRRRIHSLGLDDAVAAQYVRYADMSEHGPIWDTAEAIKAGMPDSGLRYLFLDSIIMATGGLNKYDSDVAAKWSSGLAATGMASCSLAHINRAGDNSKPYGTSFFHNLARTTYSLEREGARDRKLIHRKSNNYPMEATKLVNVDFNAINEPIHVGFVSWSQSIADRISEVLDLLTEATAKEITEYLNAMTDSDGNPVKALTERNVRTTMDRQSGIFAKDTSVRPEKWRTVVVQLNSTK